jgi:hypothetical protein
MRPRPGILALLVLAWLSSTGAFLGCDLFTPAEPEIATNPTPPVNVDLSDPDSTLSTMARAMAAKVDGQSAYMQTLADPEIDGVAFTATFDPAVVALWTGAPPGTWTPDRERLFFGGFIGLRAGDEYLMRWEVDVTNPDDPQSDPRVLHRRYQVFAVSASGADTTRIAVGFATLTFQLTNGSYVIRLWEDRVDPSVGAAPDDDDDRTFSWRRLEQS